MGSTNSTIIKVSTVKSVDLSPPDNKKAQIGEYLYIPNEIEKKQTARWEKFISRKLHLEDILNSIKESKLHKGIPLKFRWESWKSLLKANKNLQNYYSLQMNSEYKHDIEKDLDRTFPEHLYFDKANYGYFGQSALRRILNKFACKYSKIGYYQGMNFIVGFLLMVSGGKEAEVFSFLESFYSKFNLSSFFCREMTGLKHYLYIFDKLFESKLCKLYWHFKNKEISEDMWVFKYFLTFFTSDFPIHITAYIWDFLLLDTFDNIFRVVLSLLKLNQERLLKCSKFKIMQFFHSLSQLQIEPQALLKKARKIKVSPQKKAGYDREYKSLPCPIKWLSIEKKEAKSLVVSPKITVQMVIEESPELLPMFKSRPSNDYKQIINPFLVESIDKSFSGESAHEDSFDAEDVLNNLVTENDLEDLYIR